MACAVVSAVTVFRYQVAVNQVLGENLFDIDDYVSSQSLFTGKDKKPELTNQEKVMVAISVLVVVFSVIEIALAFGGAASSESCYHTPQANQVSQVFQVINGAFVWKYEIQFVL